MTEEARGRGDRFPARLHVLLARQAPIAVVLRQGPSKQVCVLGWDRRTDEVAVGQWLKGRIYPTRCDIAPDGRHWLYFALDGKWDSETKGSYTVLARVPYLRALYLWPQGDTWGGGGLFVSSEAFTVFGGGIARVTAPDRLVDGSITDRSWYAGPIYDSRLVRDGWTALGETRLDGLHSVRTFERDAGRGWTLRKIEHATSGPRAPGKGIPYEEHALVRSDREVPLPAWEWADVDGKRLVWAEKGCLYAGKVGREGLGEVRLLNDLNDLRFEPIRAPYGR